MPAGNKPARPDNAPAIAGLAPLPADTELPCLVACSGGYDSSGLLQLLVARGLPLVMGHVRHGWRRPAEEEADLRCLRETARRLALPLLVAVAAPTHSEADARHERYRLLRALAAQSGAGCLVTAHHRGDQLESVLLALLRGSGLRGLRGIAARRALDGLPLLRPALGVSRQRLVAAVVEAGLPVSEDSSNRSLRPRRNWLRQRVIPGLAADLRARLLELAQLCQQLDAALAEGLPGVEPGELPAAGAAWPLLLLGAQARLALPAAAARRLDLAGCQRLRALLRRELRGVQLPGGVRGEPAGRGVALLEDPCPPPGTQMLPVPGRVELAARGWLAAAWRARPPSGWLFSAGPCALLSPLAVQLPLEVGTPRPGERFRPLGAPGRRKIMDLLREHGVPVSRRAGWPVVRDRQGVIWLAGVAVADRVQLPAQSQTALRLEGQAGAWS